MIKLSYSTMNALIHEPHTWLNKQMGLKTFSTVDFEEGKKAHRIIQDHVSGKILNKRLETIKLPTFSIVEEKDWDERVKVEYRINDNYMFHGWVDGLEPTRGDFLEMKSGKVWSPGDFARLIQWQLYALGLPDYKKVWFINTPKNPDLWLPSSIKVVNIEITDDHKTAAKNFINKAIYILENLHRIPLHVERRSRWCYYEGCPYGCENG